MPPKDRASITLIERGQVSFYCVLFIHYGVQGFAAMLGFAAISAGANDAAGAMRQYLWRALYI